MKFKIAKQMTLPGVMSEEMTSEQFLKLRERSTPEFYRIAELRRLIQRRKSALSEIERRFERDTMNLI